MEAVTSLKNDTMPKKHTSKKLAVPTAIRRRLSPGINVQGCVALLTEDLGVQVAELDSGIRQIDEDVAAALADRWNACINIPSPATKVPAMAAFAAAVASLNNEGYRIPNYGTVELDVQDAYALLSLIIKEARRLTSNAKYRPSKAFQYEVSEAAIWREEASR